MITYQFLPFTIFIFLQKYHYNLQWCTNGLVLKNKYQSLDSIWHIKGQYNLDFNHL